jgi:hypothetical protein
VQSFSLLLLMFPLRIVRTPMAVLARRNPTLGTHGSIPKDWLWWKKLMQRRKKSTSKASGQQQNTAK